MDDIITHVERKDCGKNEITLGNIELTSRKSFHDFYIQPTYLYINMRLFVVHQVVCDILRIFLSMLIITEYLIYI